MITTTHDFGDVALRTERLILRPWSEADVGAIADACQDALIQANVPIPAPYRRSDAEYFVREVAPKGRAAGTDVVFGVFPAPAGEPVASIGLHKINGVGAEHGGAGEIGYWTAPGARGRGYTAEAVRAMCGWGFEELGLAGIEWIAVAGNEGSWRVAEKAGFVREGTLRAFPVHRGVRGDAWIGSLLRHEARLDGNE